jgi:amino acid adenylation domain-containing protein
MNAMNQAPQASNLEAVYPLSPMQQGMLFHSLHAPPDSGMYVQQIVCTLRGDLDPGILRDAWQAVLDRHAALRTFFVWDDRPEPLQVVCRQLELPWRELDWRDDADADSRLAELLAADRRRGFDTARAPLLRLTLARTAGDDRLIWTFHHLLIDGWCLPTILSEVAERHAARRAGRPFGSPAPRPYRDFIEWLGAQDRDAALTYWKRQLDGFGAATPLGLQPPHPGPDRAGFAEHEVCLSERATEALLMTARRERVTLGVCLQVAWALALYRYSGDSDVVFGATVAGRPPSLEGVESMVGVFINTVPVRISLPPRARLLDVLRDLHARQAEREPYAHAPLVEIQAASGVLGGTPLFETLVVIENYPIDGSRTLGGVELVGVRGHDRTHYPVTLLAVPGRGLRLTLAHDRDRLGSEAASRLLGLLAEILEAMPGHVHHPLSRLPTLTRAEHAERAAWNRTARHYPQATTLAAMVAAAVAQHPGGEAVRFCQESLSYAELDARAERFARRLGALGVGPETVVGVCLERSVELVVTLLGIVKAGAAYLPLEPTLPPQRLAFMLDEARAPMVVAQGSARRALSDTVRVIAPEAPHTDARAGGDDARLPGAHAEAAAYVIFTSGSTGVPKGVINTQRGICNRLAWMQEALALEPGERVLQKTPYGFDVSVWEFFWPLTSGACAVLAEPERHRDPAYIADLIRRERITTLHFVPPMLSAFLEEPTASECDSLTRVICSGEALTPELAERCRQRLRSRLYNLYGPTEVAIDVTWWRCEGNLSRVPIGWPLANCQAHVLDADRRPVPVGAPGELYLGGVQLARGYAGRAALTAERFVPNPFATRPGERLYRTGDRARFGPDGSIEYLGRLDHQIKVRGVRVEPAEIETRLRTHPGVAEALVCHVPGPDAATRLVGYVVARGQPQPAREALLAHLRAFLPEAMVPREIVFLEQLPLSANGKVDRRALPHPDPRRAPQGRVAPASALEREIASVWREVLNIDDLGVDDNFFDLGGSSLSLVPVHRRLAAGVAPGLDLLDLFRLPTIRALAAHLEGSGCGDGGSRHRGTERDARRGAFEDQRRARHSARTVH